MPDADLTELIEIDPDRVDLVKSPANGFPVLLMKAVNAQGGIDEKPDIAGAENVMQCLARLIQSEAAELATGQWDEVCDIELLLQATHLMGCFRAREMYGDVDDGEPYAAKDADFPTQDELESAVWSLAKRKVSAAERKRLAAANHALPDGSYPIDNEEDLHNAAILARSGHGDVAAAKRLIAKRAKELGVANPLANDNAAKDAESVVEDQETPEAVEPQVDEPVEKSVGEQVQEAVAEAMKDRDEAIEGLRNELATLKDTPIPGGPVITVPQSQRTAAEKATALGEAERFERLAKSTGDRELAGYYERQARVLRKAADA